MDIKVVEKAFSEKLKEGENLRFYIDDVYCFGIEECVEVIADLGEDEPTEIKVYAGIDGWQFIHDGAIWVDELHQELGKIAVSAEGDILSYSVEP